MNQTNQLSDTTAGATGLSGGVGLRPPRNRLDRRVIGLWTVQGLFVAGPVVVGAWVAAVLFTDMPLVIWLAAIAITLLGIGTMLVEPRWSYAVSRWEVTEEAVYTRTGWFLQKWRIAPMSRIQRVDNARGPLQQLFGLSSVSVTTASSAGQITIDGLDHELARELVEQLTKTTHRTPGDAT